MRLYAKGPSGHYGAGFSYPEFELVVIGDRLWQAQFKRDPAVLGREIYINGTRFKLIGIAPPRKLDSSLGWKLQGNNIRRI